MIKVSFSRSADGFSFDAFGHAGYSDSGDDIICAAVSGIVYALAGYLINECNGAVVKALRPGAASFRCGGDGEAAMRMAYIGLLQLALTYPDFVSVRCDAWCVTVGEAREVVA